jgi:hypothetical protein
MNSKTIDPQLTQINLFYKKDFYNKASNFLSTVNNYSTELQASIDYSLTKVQNDVITSQRDFFIKLDNQMKSMQPQFAADWISKFNTALNEVKNQVRIKINEGTFYKQFSDSIGSLARIENYLDDSLQLVSDVTGSKMMTPLRYGASLTNKMSPSTQLLHAELSKKTNIVFRKNIQNIQSTVQSGNVSQGGNLTPDTQHFVRMKNAIPSLNQKIQSEFKELYNVIQLYCNYNPRAATNNIQFVPNTNISVNVEGSTLNQDLLFNQLKEVTSSVTTRKVLGVS